MNRVQIKDEFQENEINEIKQEVYADYEIIDDYEVKEELSEYDYSYLVTDESELNEHLSEKLADVGTSYLNTDAKESIELSPEEEPEIYVFAAVDSSCTDPLGLSTTIETTISNKLIENTKTSTKQRLLSHLKTKAETNFANSSHKLQVKKPMKTYSRRKPNGIAKVTIKHVCYMCKKIFPNEILLSFHQKLKHKVKCKRCNLLFLNVESWRDHQINSNCSKYEDIQKMFPGLKPTTKKPKRNMNSCDICYVQFDCSDELNEHRKSHHFAAFACHMCNKKFDTIEATKIHLKHVHLNRSIV